MFSCHLLKIPVARWRNRSPSFFIWEKKKKRRDILKSLCIAKRTGESFLPIEKKRKRKGRAIFQSAGGKGSFFKTGKRDFWKSRPHSLRGKERRGRSFCSIRREEVGTQVSPCSRKRALSGEKAWSAPSQSGRRRRA